MGFDDIIYNTAAAGTIINPNGLPPGLCSLLVAQAAHETGNFTSNIFKNFNNAFGYSYVPDAVYQFGSGSIADNGKPVAAYRSVQDSVKEMIDWIYRRKKEGKFPADLSTIRTPDQYAALLKGAGFYTDSVENYAAGITRYFIRVMQDLSKPIPLLLIAAIGLSIYWIMKNRK